MLVSLQPAPAPGHALCADGLAVPDLEEEKEKEETLEVLKLFQKTFGCVPDEAQAVLEKHPSHPSRRLWHEFGRVLWERYRISLMEFVFREYLSSPDATGT